MREAVPAPCPGDCDGDGVVEIQELVRGVRILLEQLPLNACPSFDTDFSGTVSIGELVAAVVKLINGCADRGIDLAITGGQAGSSTGVGLIFLGADIDVFVIGFELCFDPEVFGADSVADACRVEADVSLEVLSEPFGDGRPCFSLAVTSTQGERPPSDCCEDHIGAGCFHDACEECVCAEDDECCDPGSGWTSSCTQLAESRLSGLGSCAVNCLCLANGPIPAGPFSLLTCDLNVDSDTEPGHYFVTTRTVLKGENEERFFERQGDIEIFESD